MSVGLRNQMKSVAISFATANDNTIVAAVAGKSIIVVSMLLSAAAPATVTVKDGAATLLSGAMSLATGVPLVLPVDPTIDWYVTTAGNALILNQGAGTIQISGTVWYILY